MPVDPNGTQQLVEEWRDRIQQARAARKPFEPGMLSDLAFAAGQQWLVYDQKQKRMRHISEVDPAFAGRELYAAERINEYRQAQLGELASDDDRPQLLAAQAGDGASDSAAELNQATGYAWEHEWNADDALRQARQYVVDTGVAAVRCRWDPSRGPVVSRAPLDASGNPVIGEDVLSALEQTGMLPDGSLPKFKPVKEGRTSWEAYSSLQILTPPGVTHERDFPWEILARPVPISALESSQYGSKANGLIEDTDIASAVGITTGSESASGVPQQNRLRGHVWLYTCFQRPTAKYPDGRMAVIASNKYVLLDSKDELPYRLPNGDPHAGVVYLHWWRLSDRFWSRSFISALKDPQRIINRRETQNIEIIDRGMPYRVEEEGAVIEEPTGMPMDRVVIGVGKNPPVSVQGAGPGAWMYQDMEHHAENLSHASTLSPLRLGENPQNVDTYSQLALLNENEAIKRSIIQIDHRAQTATLVELSVGDIFKYWPEEKQILIAGDEDVVRQQVFRKSKAPTFYMVKVAKGAPQPRSQAAELKKIDAIWAAAVQSGAVTGDPQSWVEWYTASVEAGSVQELPQPQRDSQQQMAQLENLLMQQGQLPQVMDYDLLPVHLPEHREAMDAARASGDMPTLQLLLQHVQDHAAAAAANAARTAQLQAGAAAAAAGAPQPGGQNPAYVQPDFQRLASGL